MTVTIPFPSIPKTPYETRLIELIKRLNYLIKLYGEIKIPVYGLSSVELFELMLYYKITPDQNKHCWLINHRPGNE